MLIGKDFIFVHVPKTGGIFVRDILEQLRRKSVRGGFVTLSAIRFILLFVSRKCGQRRIILVEKILNKMCPRFPLQGTGTISIHEVCTRIPESDRHKLVFSVKRDIFAYYVSCYTFKATREQGIFQWRSLYKKEGRADPDFDEFVTFFDEVLPRQLFRVWTGRHLSAAIGFMTFIYIWFFFRNPAEVLVKTDEQLADYFESQRYRQDLYPVHFLRTEHLSEDLHDFLLGRGFSRKELGFVLTQDKVNVSRHDDLESYHDQKLIDYIEEKNWIYRRYFL